MKLFRIMTCGLALLALGFVSCIKDRTSDLENCEAGIPVTFTVQAGDAPQMEPTPVHPDYAVDHALLLVYDHQTGRLVEKFPLTPNGETPIDMRTGRYDFVFLANWEWYESGDVMYNSANAQFGFFNETSDDIFDPLNTNGGSDDSDIETLTRLRGHIMKLTHSLPLLNYDGETLLPMVKFFEGSVLSLGADQKPTISYQGSEQLSGSGATKYWPVQLDRTVVRLDITLTIDADQYDQWNSDPNITETENRIVEIQQVNTSNYLLPGMECAFSPSSFFLTALEDDSVAPNQLYSSTNNVPRSPKPGTISDESGGKRTITFERVILPEFLLNSTYSSEANAMLLALSFNDGNDEVIYKTGILTGPAGGYNIPRNSYLRLNIDVEADQEELAMDITVMDWNDITLVDGKFAQYDLKIDRSVVELGGELNTRAWLNISTTYPQVSSADAWRFEFSDPNSWLGIQHSNGSGGLEFSAQAANPKTMPRSATVDIIAGNMRKTITVVQQPIILCPPGVLGVTASGKLTLRGSKEFAGSEVATGPGRQGTREFGDLSDETVYIAYFKWGSLLAMYGTNAEDGSSESSFTPDAIAWVPEGYAFGSLEETRSSFWEFYNFGYMMTVLWDNSIPPYGASEAGTSGYHLPATNDTERGYGDPCTLADDGKYAEWRVPSIHANGGWNGLQGDDLEYAGVIGIPGYKTSDYRLFLPYAGYRQHSAMVTGFLVPGLVQQTGTALYYWSSTSRSLGSNYAYLTAPPLSYSVESTSASSNNAYPIRCVKPVAGPTLEMVRHNLPADDKMISQAGGTFKGTVRTNLAGWGLRVYHGEDNSGNPYFNVPYGQEVNTEAVEEYMIPGVFSSNETGINLKWSIYLFATEFETGNTTADKAKEIKIGTWTQASRNPTAPVTSAPRITWLARNGTYVLTQDATDAGLYFKFGSVVGIFSGKEGSNAMLPAPTDQSQLDAMKDEFDAGDIAWTPLTRTDNWMDIYSYNDEPMTVTPESGYHSDYSVVAYGKGDPCRLVGINLNTLTQTMHVDNNLWRLPTYEENKAFTTLTGSWYPTGDNHWWDGGVGVSPFDGVAGGEFLKKSFSAPMTEARAASFLPATGMRNLIDYGLSTGYGDLGHYWTSTPSIGNDSGCELGFNNSWLDLDGVEPYNVAFSVRCVRQ